MFDYFRAAKSAQQVLFETVEAARSRVIGFASVAVMSCLLLFVVALDIRTPPARPRCRCLAKHAPAV